MILIQITELEKIANDFLESNYQLTLTIPITRNNRLKSSLGRLVYTSKLKPVKIELAGITLDYARDEVIVGILKHECIHLALLLAGNTSTDGDAYFESELIKYGAPSTHTIKVGSYFLYRCEICYEIKETNVQRVAKFPHRYRTKCCNGKLNILGERIYDGETYAEYYYGNEQIYT